MNITFNNTEEIGINVIHKIITQDYGWIFREKTKRDIGIDAEIETKAEGLIIQVQIKTGAGNFKILKSNPNGLTFYVNNYHYQYWTNLKSPILFIAHIPESKKTYWQVVNSNNLVKANKRWKLFIPYNQELIQACKEEILDSFLEITKPEIIFKPNHDGTAQVTSCTIDMGRPRSTDDEAFSNILQKIQEQANRYFTISQLKQKLYENPNDYKSRIAIALEYIFLTDLNNARIELSSIISHYNNLQIKEKADFSNRASLQWARYYLNSISNSNEVDAYELTKAKSAIHIKLFLLGTNTFLINLSSVKILIGQKELEMKKYTKDEFILPYEQISQTLLNNPMVKFKTSFNFEIGNNGEKPTLEKYSYSISFGIIRKDKYLEEYSTQLM
jgi:hypothetical protein